MRAAERIKQIREYCASLPDDEGGCCIDYRMDIPFLLAEVARLRAALEPFADDENWQESIRQTSEATYVDYEFSPSEGAAGRLIQIARAALAGAEATS